MYRIIFFSTFLILFLIIIIFTFTNSKSKQKNSLPKTYVINLKETQEGNLRWKKIQTLFPNAKRFQGIYGKTYNYNKEIAGNIIVPEWDIGKWKNTESKIIKMTPGEIGVSLSHYNLWKKIANSNEPTLILEDDAHRPSHNFNDKVSFLIQKLPKDWDIFLLGFWLHKGDDGYKVNNYISKVNSFVLLYAYIINPKGANKLLDCLPINMPLDSWISSCSHKINIYRHNLNNFSMKPRSTLIKTGRRPSQIEHTNNW